jgi:hypothetical protein
MSTMWPGWLRRINREALSSPSHPTRGCEGFLVDCIEGRCVQGLLFRLK